MARSDDTAKITGQIERGEVETILGTSDCTARRTISAPSKRARCPRCRHAGRSGWPSLPAMQDVWCRDCFLSKTS